MNNTKQLLHDYIASEFLDEAPMSLSNNENLIEAGVVDSMAILLLIKFIEENFTVTIEPEDVIVENFESIEAISNLVKLRTAK